VDNLTCGCLTTFLLKNRLKVVQSTVQEAVGESAGECKERKRRWSSGEYERYGASEKREFNRLGHLRERPTIDHPRYPNERRRRKL
jgi:hypothetical protein